MPLATPWNQIPLGMTYGVMIKGGVLIKGDELISGINDFVHVYTLLGL